MGIPAQFSATVNLQDLQNKVMSGSMGGVSTPAHYFALQGYDPNTGLFDTGQTGSIFRGGNRYLSWNDITRLGGTPSGVFTLAPNQNQQQQQPQVQTSFNPATQTMPSTGQTGVPPEFANKPYAQEAYNAALQAGIDPNIFLRQINQESGFNANAGSSAGAQGIAQIVPKYHPGVNTADPIASLNYAANLDKQLLTQYGGDYTQALVAYNGGSGAVNAWNGGNGYTESKTYVNNILGGQTPASFTTQSGGTGTYPQSNTDFGGYPQGKQTPQGPQRPQGVPGWIPQSMWGEYNNGPTSLTGTLGSIMPRGGMGLPAMPQLPQSSFNATPMPFSPNSFSMPEAQSNWIQSEQNLPMYQNPFSMATPMSAPAAQPNIMSRMSRPISLYG
jgi:hypothetical protein